MATDDLYAAQRWFERAFRIAPTDDVAALSLATFLLRSDPTRAASIAQEVAGRADIKAASLCLISAYLLTADPERTAEALTNFLRKYAVFPNEIGMLERAADFIGRGWVGVTADGECILDRNRLASIVIDGDVSCSDRALPRLNRTGRELEAVRNNAPLLGSPLDLRRHRLVEGFVRIGTQGAQGWCWRPSAPGASVSLSLIGRGGRSSITAAAPAQSLATGLRQPLSLLVESAVLSRMQAPYRLMTMDNRELPTAPWELEQAHPHRRVTKLRQRSPRLDYGVIMLLGRANQHSWPCIRSIVAGSAQGTVVLLIGEAADFRDLDELSESPNPVAATRILSKPGESNASCINRALGRLGARDAIVVRADRLGFGMWADALAQAARSAPDVGIAVPFGPDRVLSSALTLVSGVTQFDADDIREQADILGGLSDQSVHDIVCAADDVLYIRRECLDQCGGFRDGVFGRGPGAGTDYSLRCANQGWRTVLAGRSYLARPSAAHAKAVEDEYFGHAHKMLERLHPGWPATLARLRCSEALNVIHRYVNKTMWQRHVSMSRVQLIVTHDDGGGTERFVRQRCAHLNAAGRGTLVARPAMNGAGVVVSAGPLPSARQLTLRLPDCADTLRQLLVDADVQGIEYHHMLGHERTMLNLPRILDLPYDVYLHDYAHWCPRLTLVGPGGTYCGEPDIEGCRACVDQQGSLLNEDVSLEGLRERSQRFLAEAAILSAPSADTARRFRRWFGREVLISEPENITLPSACAKKIARPHDGMARVAVVGAIGIAKGYDVLLSCARDAATRNLPLHFSLIGHSIDDKALLDTGRCDVTGQFAEGEASNLLHELTNAVGFIPSVWPETWCYALSELWAAGLRAVAFDIGSPADRIGMSGRGFVIPMGLDPGIINERLLAAAQQDRWTLESGLITSS